jgi:hypothetical protein
MTVEKKSKSMESMLLQLTPEELAQQICVHNFTLFNNIHPSEFLDQIWRKDDDSTTPYLTTFIQRFDKEYYWVATEIVSQKDLKKRVTILKTFILAAKVCLYHNIAAFMIYCLRYLKNIKRHVLITAISSQCSQ